MTARRDTRGDRRTPGKAGLPPRLAKNDLDASTHPVLQLQHSVGNRATAAVVQSDGGPPASTAERIPGQATQAKSALIRDRDIFANLWLEAAGGALAVAPEAKDKESTANWWVALAGNLLWAASSLLAPEAVLAIRMMSFVGAAVGSGVLAQDLEKAPSGKETIGELLTQTRDLMVRTAGPMVDAAVAECVSGDVTDPEEQRKVLWHKLFRSPYNESEPIRAEMSSKIKSGLAEFLAQWHEWNDAIDKDSERGFTTGLGPEVFAQPEVVAEYRKDPQKAWMLEQDPVTRVGALKRQLQQERPFRAKLSF